MKEEERFLSAQADEREERFFSTQADERGGEISLYAGRRFRRSESGRKSRPAPFEKTGVGAE
jgi:hypothetical protein